MKKRCGLSVSMWLWSAVMAMPLSRRARITGFTSFPTMTKSPVIAALPPPVGWKLIAVARPLEDRKSTRLNSSHGYISYAVFCLKKKKNGRQIDSDQVVGGQLNAAQAQDADDRDL